jgi:hypothetical protein
VKPELARDGSSYERALLDDSWRWLNEHHPGWRLRLQKLASHEDRYIDVVLIELPSGEVREVYFDVTTQFEASMRRLLEEVRQSSPERPS